MEIDEEDVGLSVGGVDDVAVPDLLAQCPRRPGIGAPILPRHRQDPIFTISTRSVPPGASYSTTSPGDRPSRACPRGEPGETTLSSSLRSSIEPTRKRSISSSPSYRMARIDP